jgi:hypothetical protein
MKLLQWTSLWISIPALLSYWLGSSEDALVLWLQCLGGIWHHTAYSKRSLFVDRLVTLGVAIRAFCISYASPVSFLVYLFSYGYIYTIYVYGKQQRRLAWDPDITVGNQYHGSMHVVCGITYVGQVWLVQHKTLPSWWFAVHDLKGVNVFYYNMMHTKNETNVCVGGG